MKNIWISLCLMAVPAGMVGGQDAPPATDIYVVETAIANGRFEITGIPTNATDRDAYDNQPFFLPDGKAFLYTAFQNDGQTDIFRYDIAAQSSRRLTATSEGEYSPTVMPGAKSFSVIFSLFLEDGPRMGGDR
jgi:Tol biopolymer transport system component